jgi:hypothetical protein
MGFSLSNLRGGLLFPKIPAGRQTDGLPLAQRHHRYGARHGLAKLGANLWVFLRGI